MYSRHPSETHAQAMNRGQLSFSPSYSICETSTSLSCLRSQVLFSSRAMPTASSTGSFLALESQSHIQRSMTNSTTLAIRSASLSKPLEITFGRGRSRLFGFTITYNETTRHGTSQLQTGIGCVLAPHQRCWLWKTFQKVPRTHEATSPTIQVVLPRPRE